jgi:hypothetical protein
MPRVGVCTCSAPRRRADPALACAGQRAPERRLCAALWRTEPGQQDLYSFNSFLSSPRARPPEPKSRPEAHDRSLPKLPKGFGRGLLAVLAVTTQARSTAHSSKRSVRRLRGRRHGRLWGVPGERALYGPVMIAAERLEGPLTEQPLCSSYNGGGVEPLRASRRVRSGALRHK